MEKQKELAVRKAAAKHLKGIPARQNASAVSNLETSIAYDEIVSRFGAGEIARCIALEESLGLL